MTPSTPPSLSRRGALRTAGLALGAAALSAGSGCELRPGGSGGPAVCPPLASGDPLPDRRVSRAATRAELWRDGAEQHWRVGTGIVMDEFDQDETLRGLSACATGPCPSTRVRLAHQGPDVTVIAREDTVTGIATQTGDIRWTARLPLTDGPAGVVLGEVTGGLLWTSCGAVDIATGQIHPVPEAVAEATALLAHGDGLIVATGTHLMRLRLNGCGQEWSTRIDAPITSLARHTSDEIMTGVGHVWNPSTGAYLGMVDLETRYVSDRLGVHLLVPQTDGTAVILDASQVDGAPVLRCLTRAEELDLEWPDEDLVTALSTAPTAWTQEPGPAAGRVLGWSTEHGAPADTSVEDVFWLLELPEASDDGAVLSRWGPRGA